MAYSSNTLLKRQGEERRHAPLIGARPTGNYCSGIPTGEYLVLSEEPMAITAELMVAPMPVAISIYSIVVAADSSAKKPTWPGSLLPPGRHHAFFPFPKSRLQLCHYINRLILLLCLEDDAWSTILRYGGHYASWCNCCMDQN